MLTSLVLLLVVRVAWAKPGKLEWKYNSVPQCPPVTRALCAGLWLILAIATLYSALGREAAGVGSLPKRKWQVVAGARRSLAVPALSALCCSLMLAIHSLDPGRLGSRRAVGPGWCEMSASGLPRGLNGSGEKFVRFSSGTLPAASKEPRHPPVAHLAVVALPGLILSNA